MAARILFNGLAAGSGGGVGRYAAELGRRLALADERVSVVCTREGAAHFAGVPAGRLIAWAVPPLPKGRLLLEEFRLPRLANQFDLLYQPDFKLPRGVRVPAIVTAHDLFYDEFPEDYGNFQRRYKGTQARRAAGKSAMLVSLTKTQSEKIAARYRLVKPPRVIAPGITAVGAPPRNPAQPPFLLCLAGREGRKQGSLAILANAAAGRPFFVKWVGGPASTEPGAAALPRQSDAQLRELFSGATALVAPSRDEGFGLPILEAIAANCPVLCSDIPALRESFGKAPVYVGAGEARWAESLRKAAAIPPVLDPAARAEVLARHEWPRAIAAHLALIAEVLGRSGTVNDPA